MRVDKKLLLIFILALVLRVAMLSAVPAGFHNDEVDVGYVGKFILLNGRDPAGNVLPLAFNKFGDFRPTGLFYLSGLLQLVFGSSIPTVRLPAAIFGALTVFPVFYLTLLIFKKKTPAYLAGLFLAILPWHIVLSRAVHEAIVGYFLVSWGLYCLIRYLENSASKKTRRLLALSILLLASSYLFYHGTRIIVPLLLACVLAVWRTKAVLKITLFFAAMTILVAILPIGRGRLEQVVFYKDPGLADKLRDLPTADGGKVVVARIFHNKVVVFSRGLVESYLQYFSPNFLFLHGGYPERYVVPEAGLVYVFMVPFLVWGVIGLSRGSKWEFLPIFWILVAPLPGVLTYDDIPSVTRASFMAIPLVMVAGYGASQILNMVKRVKVGRLAGVIFVIVALFEMVYFGHEYVVHQRSRKAILRDQGTAEMAQYVASAHFKYDFVVVPYHPNLVFYYLFFAGDYARDIKVDISGGSDRFQRGNVLFLRDGCPAQREFEFDSKNVLYIDQEDCQMPNNKVEVATFPRPDSTVAFKAFVKSGMK